MKSKNLLPIFLIAGILTTSVSTWLIYGQTPQISIIQSSTIPTNLKVVFKNACMDCHSSGGSMLAKSALDFSKWDQYKTDKQAKKAADICKEVSTNSMPPKSFINSNPKANLTVSQKDTICNWSKKFATKK